MDNDYFIHETAIIDDGAKIGAGSKIWHFVHVCSGAEIGRDCVLGQNVYVGGKAQIGNGVKIQNNVSVYDGVVLEDNVFCGPSMVFTNVTTPRAHVERKDSFEQTIVGQGTTFGANCTIVCGVKIGAYALIGAGAVVTKNVQAHAIMTGVPAQHSGWVSHAGEVLGDDLVCSYDGSQYAIIDGELVQK